MLRKLLIKKIQKFSSDLTKKNIIGVDFGSSFISSAIVENNQPKIIENNEGFRSTPCVVAFNKENQKLIGSAAKRQAIINGEFSYSNLRRFIGKKYSDPEIQTDIKQSSFKILESKDGGLCFFTPLNQEITPTEIISHIFAKIKEGAEGGLHKDINNIVVSIPTYFNEREKEEVKKAAQLAGLNIANFINEPIAACLAYQIDTKINKNILVYDIGGYSFDSTIVQIKDGLFDIKSSINQSTIGGYQIDLKLVELLMTEFKIQNKKDFNRNDKQAYQRLIEAVEKSKIELSTILQSEINLPYLSSDISGPLHLSYTLKRSKFESIIDSFLTSSLQICEECLKKSDLNKQNIDEILLVGGISKIPYVRTTVEKYFNKQTNKTIDTDEVIAFGTAIQASTIINNEEQVITLEHLPLSIGIETIGGMMQKIIDKNTQLPLLAKFSISPGSNQQTNLNLKFYYGERLFVQNNILLGQFDIAVSPINRENNQIEITLEINENGFLKVVSKDKLALSEQTLTSNIKLDLSPEKVNELQKLAKDFKIDDEKKIKIIKKKIEIDNLVCQLDQEINIIGKYIPENEEKNIKELIQNVNMYLNKDQQNEYLKEKENLIKRLNELKSIKKPTEEKSEKKNKKLNKTK